MFSSLQRVAQEEVKVSFSFFVAWSIAELLEARRVSTQFAGGGPDPKAIYPSENYLPTLLVYT